MRKQTSRILVLASFLLVLLLIGAFIIYQIAENKPPAEEIKRARENITLAKVNNASKYAKDLVDRSVVLYDSAMFCWEQENQKFFLFRKYNHIEYLANESIKLSMAASQKATSNANHLKSELKKELNELNKRITNYKSKFDIIPQEKLWKQFNKGKLRYEEARAAYDNEQLLESKKKLSEAKAMIDHSHSEAAKSLSEYFKNYPEWKRIANAAVQTSRTNNNYAIVVDKFSRECLLYYKGNVIDKYQVELGKNWMGGKNHSGDMSTPEGSYKVTDRKERGRTKYYKALLINYPNEEDKRNYKDKMKNGQIARNKSIGGLIEIHGSGGQGADWTDGCIALSNKEMDRLYAKASVGTPIIIVGSLTPLDSLFK
ncbi:MAG: L,D-transpeptidase family protein [Prolixibacteraceae bacterium]